MPITQSVRVVVLIQKSMTTKRLVFSLIDIHIHLMALFSGSRRLSPSYKAVYVERIKCQKQSHFGLNTGV